MPFTLTTNKCEEDMKLTDIIDSMNKHLAENGDTEVLSFKMVDVTGGFEWFKYSKSRVHPVTRIPMRMTPKEFMQEQGLCKKRPLTHFNHGDE